MATEPAKMLSANANAAACTQDVNSVLSQERRLRIGQTHSQQIRAGLEAHLLHVLYPSDPLIPTVHTVAPAAGRRPEQSALLDGEPLGFRA